MTIYRCPACGDDMEEISSSPMLTECECPTCDSTLYVDLEKADAANADG